VCRNDHYYYPLYQLPELLILVILATPTLMARIALEYPRVQDVPDPQDSFTSSDSGTGTSGDLESGAQSTQSSGSDLVKPHDGGSATAQPHRLVVRAS
jgi:hypothetical protein